MNAVPEASGGLAARARSPLAAARALRGAWTAAAARYAARPLRERVLALLAAIATVGFLVDYFAWSPAQRRLAAAQARIDAADAATGQAREGSPEQAAAREREALARQRVAVDARIEALRSGLLAPQQARELVGEMASRMPGLVLLRLRNLPPTQVRAGNATVPLYRHPIEISVQGGFHDLLRFLVALETGPRGIRWSGIEIDASAHPAVVLTVSAYTLSEDPQWLAL